MYFRPSTFRRLLAHYIDSFFLVLIFVPLFVQILANWVVDGSLHIPLVFFLMTYFSYLFFLIVSYSFFSGSIGKWLMGLRLVSVSDADVTLFQVLIRVLADQLRWFFGWGLFCLALIRFDRRHFSDWMAETKVVQILPENEFPRRYVLTGLALFVLLSVIGWSSVQERWSHVELRDKQIYFEL